MNDAFGTSFRGGQILLTESVAALPDMVKASALEKVAAFQEFDEENDPRHEHDYGSFDHCDREVWWKIDYFDVKLEHASPDPTDTLLTKRVMTIGLAQDW